MNAKISFFDQNSIGKIITRFSKDIAVLDRDLPFKFSILSLGFFRMFTIILVISLINSWVIIIVIIFGFIVISFIKRNLPVLRKY